VKKLFETKSEMQKGIRKKEKERSFAGKSLNEAGQTRGFWGTLMAKNNYQERKNGLAGKPG